MKEIESLAALRAHLAEFHELENVVIQGLDLRDETDALLADDLHDAVFLGCKLSDAAMAHATGTGALIFPRLPDLPYRSYRPTLYTVAELMEGHVRGDADSFARDSRDGKIYAHYSKHRHAKGGPPILETLAQRLHDHAIDDALEELLHNDGEPLKVVAIMGGHAMKRGEPAYRAVTEIARALTRAGYFLASGGGPGAMEATHLGAWFANADDALLPQAVDILSPAPSYKDPAWFDTAYEVLDLHPKGLPSLGVPTWFYGHEPTNLFATHVAKYFSNSLREDGLLAIATHGVIYAPGSAGTIQEIFMDAAQNHYGTFQMVSPMVFFDRTYWTETRPVYGAVQNLAAGKQYADMLTITDDVDEAVAYIDAHPPVPYAG